jgi:hypothetical protein
MADRGGLLGIDALYEALAKTKVEHAKASVDEDRIVILDTVASRALEDFITPTFLSMTVFVIGSKG